LAFTVQPASVVAGSVIAPTVKVSVEDSNNNVVTSNNTASITIVRTSCSGVVPVGGGPLTVSNGVAAFPSLTLQSVGTGVQLQATASGLTSATSSAFNVTANPDFIFQSGFQTCIP